MGSFTSAVGTESRVSTTTFLSEAIVSVFPAHALFTCWRILEAGVSMVPTTASFIE